MNNGDSQITFPEVIDSSMLAAFKSCPQLFFKLYMAHWKSKTEKPDLHAGKAFAHGLEIARKAYFEHMAPAPEAEAHGLAALTQAYGDFQCPPDNPKSLERMMGAYEFYMQHYPLTMGTGYPIIVPGGKRAIEMSFTHPLAVDHPETGNPILYTGRADMLFNYAQADYGLDDKTTKSLGPTWSKQWDMRAQFISYTWGFRTSGFPLAGFVVRGTSILKTKYDTQEAICNFAEWETDRWYGELLEWVGDMIQCWKTRRWRYNLDHACNEWGGCGFRSVCKMQNEQPWLEQFFERRVWDPVTRIDKRVGE